jgi:hypothetical protein
MNMNHSEYQHRSLRMQEEPKSAKPHRTHQGKGCAPEFWTLPDPNLRAYPLGEPDCWLSPSFHSTDIIAFSSSMSGSFKTFQSF